VTPPSKTKPIRVLLVWQALVTLALAAIAGAWVGANGAISAALGGGITLVANAIYALMGGIVKPAHAIGSLLLLIRAEAFKVGAVLVQLLLVLKLYEGLVPLPFIVTFIVTTLMFGIALRVRT
jgi:ATP synthase protein I